MHEKMGWNVLLDSKNKTGVYKIETETEIFSIRFMTM